jgi:hypothetical protein
MLMASRRAFVKSAALLSAGALASPALLAAPRQYIGLQLYTVRDAMQQDPAGTLAKVAQMGYNSVEGATYTGSQKFYGMEPAAFAKVLRQNGLLMPSSHYVLGEALSNGQPTQGTILHGWDKAVDDAAQVGAKYMVCAYLKASAATSTTTSCWPTASTKPVSAAKKPAFSSATTTTTSSLGPKTANCPTMCC